MKNKEKKTIEKNIFCLWLFFLVSKVREAAPYKLIQSKKIINTILRAMLLCLFNWKACSVGHFFSWHLKDTHTTV